MRYASIRKLDISNGDGVGASLFVQGCHFHCKNCFNSDTWDFNGGKQWKLQEIYKFLEIVSNSNIKRVTILGGEPLCDENVCDVLSLLEELRNIPDKKIWIYSGYRFNDILASINSSMQTRHDIARFRSILIANVMVDGRYVDELKNKNLKFRGSSNQRVIDLKSTLDNLNIGELYTIKDRNKFNEFIDNHIIHLYD